MSKEHVLVTGGAGYLGSNLVPALLEEGYKVTVLDDFMFKQHSLGHVCAHPNFHVIRGDVRDGDLMKKLLADKDIIFPLAALVGAPLCNADPVAAKTVNLEAQLSMYDMLRDDQKVIVPITNSGYGIGEEGKFCTEETPMRPISTYGIHKVAVEQRALARENTISFRLATVFGMAPRMRLDLLVNDFVYRAFYDRAVVLFESHFKRNYIHNRDVTNAFLHGLNNFDAMKGQAYNLGLSDANLSKKELCEKIAQHLPGFVFMEAEIGEDPDKRDYIVSNEKLEKTGWRPQYSLDMGIEELIKGYTMIRNSQYGNV
ncbi:NAD-dependent epimerase/dehydratase family protein [Terasakiella pusilla]|uniref:NAD-dependent epimerase/dehydratase family protein n=1 Tax=Terasakiella pusilla TaxID=64973 RepID=UPI003AA8C284